MELLPVLLGVTSPDFISISSEEELDGGDLKTTFRSLAKVDMALCQRLCARLPACKIYNRTRV